MARRTPILVLLLLAAAGGCRHRLAIVPCDGPGTGPQASAMDGVQMGPTRGVPSAEAVGMELRGSEEIRVKAPAQKVTVMLPPESGAACPPGGAQPCPPHAAPAAPPMVMAPAPAYAAPPTYAAAPLAAPALMSSEQTVRPRTRIALGFDVIRIPIPCPKLFAVQGEQEVVTRQTYQMPAAAPVVPAPVMAAPVMAAPVAAAPVAAAPVAYAPAPAAYVPVAAAPAPPPMFAPPPTYAPPPAYAPPPPQAPAMICVPGPAPCEPAACPPTGKHDNPILNHLGQMKDRLDGLERDYWKRAGSTSAAAPAVPAATVLPAPRVLAEQ